jgi:hypothetical protein
VGAVAFRQALDFDHCGRGPRKAPKDSREIRPAR